MTRGNVFFWAQKGFWYYSLWTKQLWGESISKVLNFLEKKPWLATFFFLLDFSSLRTSQSEIRRKLTSFVIWPQLPIFQLKSLLRRAERRPKICSLTWMKLWKNCCPADVVNNFEWGRKLTMNYSLVVISTPAFVMWSLLMLSSSFISLNFWCHQRINKKNFFKCAFLGIQLA